VFLLTAHCPPPTDFKMAAIPTDIEIEPAPERSRLNEIIVIALVAAALLLGCASLRIIQTILRGMPPVKPGRAIGLELSARMSRRRCFSQSVSPRI